MVPPEVLTSASKPIIHHRTAEYSNIFKEVITGLRYVFQTEGDILIFAASGTGAMEAAVTNLLSEGDHALTVNAGKFGQRWSELCKVYKINLHELKIPYGEAVLPKQIKEALDKNKDIKVVFTTLCETSTGTKMPIKEIAEITNSYEVCLVVDAISGLLADPLYQDAYNVDIVVAGSQKGMMLPPGLSFVSIAKKDKIKKLIESSKLPKYYFSFESSYKSMEKFQTPFTPAVSLIIALKEALRLINQEGLENIYNRCERLAKATREAVLHLGLSLFSKTPSNALTAINVPEGIEAKKLIEKLEEDWGVKVAEGQEEMKDKIFRIAHLGYVNEADIITTISALEFTLKDLGYNKFDTGQGVKAALSILHP
jgi:aspartate aminotransferase-like enzyme